MTGKSDYESVEDMWREFANGKITDERDKHFFFVGIQAALSLAVCGVSIKAIHDESMAYLNSIEQSGAPLQ